MPAMQTPLTTEIAYIVSEIEVQTPGTLGEKGATLLAYGLMSLSFPSGSLV